MDQKPFRLPQDSVHQQIAASVGSAGLICRASYDALLEAYREHSIKGASAQRRPMNAGVIR